ncbi:glucokinase [Ensifer sp. NM-2]|uniref:ROK family protein n=1 Tax=unclassified Ensifer TaxID=2633371 RepID=UPI00070C9004|nr:MULTISPECIES: ROK family protein [unclassified Ensifer]KQW55595.1 glucokinase [Ensifer sp. Root127]PSS64357.1 glucokinase [Ensifer sp. NM-2]
MTKATRARAEMERSKGKPIAHGAGDLPRVHVDEYNFEIKDKNGFIGDRANKEAFKEMLARWRKIASDNAPDPLGRKQTEMLSKRKIDRFLTDGKPAAAVTVWSAIEEFAHELVSVLLRYLAEKSWSGTQKVVVGGGFVSSQAGALSIKRAQMILRKQGSAMELNIIRHHPDDAGLIGSVHLLPHWMLKGHQAILAVDIGGTNIRVGVVELNTQKAKNFTHAKVGKSHVWRHADDEPNRTTCVEKVAAMLRHMVEYARKKKLDLAPAVGIACPGIIEETGSITRGAQNLPGGNWESESFNLPEVLRRAVPKIGDQDSFFVMHNDAVVQGLSQLPFLDDAQNWGVLTIGTGLGNAHFSTKPAVA